MLILHVSCDIFILPPYTLLAIGRCGRRPLLLGWYDAWIVRERERLAWEWGNASLRLGTLLAEGSKLERATELARQVLEEEPLREDACLLLRRGWRLSSSVGPAPAALLAGSHRTRLESTPSAILKDTFSCRRPSPRDGTDA